MLVKADIHIHTCLSPCAEITQSPKRVVERANEIGMNMIFITDHNSAENTGYSLKAANRYNDFNVYPGM
jgi:3',5'-nucleoside bisphosphate phosphatase